jgi:hypothetical protein
MNRNRIYIYLTLILATALGLRLWGIWFGLPFSYRADEYHEVFRALELGSGGFNFDRTGKGGYFYLLFVEYGILFVVLKIAGIVDSAQDFARYFFRDPSTFYLISRATTAIIGMLNVFLLYRIGARAYSVGAGLLAAIFLTVDFLSAEHSHFVTVDVPMTCLATAALLFAVKMATDGRSSDYKWAALFAALATTTKLPAILLLVPLLIGHYFYVRRQDGSTRELFLGRNVWWAIGIFFVVLAATNPGLFLNPPLHLTFADSGGTGAEFVDDEFAETLPAVRPNLFVFYLGVLADSMGWPLLLVSFAGVLYAIWKRSSVDIMLVSLAIAYYVVFSSTSSHLYYPRYMLPVIVVLALMAGRLLSVVWPRAGAGKQGVAIAGVAVLAFLPAYGTISNNILLTRTDTRTIAKEWFEENVPVGSKVFIEGLKIEPSRLTVPLQNSAENLRESLEYYRNRDPGKVKYIEFNLQVMRDKSYDLELAKRSDLQSFAHYKAAGVEYLVIRPETFAYARRIGEAGPALLNDLRNDPDVTLIKSFRAEPTSRPGPDIDVYRIDSSLDRTDVSSEHDD